MSVAGSGRMRFSSKVREALRGWVSIAAGVAVLLIGRASFADHYRVPSGSMEPNVEVGDRILVNKLAFGFRVPATNVYLSRFGEPQRGDVVVLSSPDDGSVLLKRVVAVPGDEVEVREGEVWLSGRLEHHGYAIRRDDSGGPPLEASRVPTDAYLVLGDNRGNSRDGRSFGFVQRSAVLGKAIAVYARDGGLVWVPL